AVPADKGIAAEIELGLELIVARTTEAGVAGIQRSGFLIEKRIGNLEGESVGEAPVGFDLQRVRTPVAEVAVLRHVVAEQREGATRQIGGGEGTVAIVGTAGIARIVERSKRRVAGRQHVAV